MPNFQNTFELCKQSFVSAFSICMTVNLINSMNWFVGTIFSTNIESMIFIVGRIRTTVVQIFSKEVPWLLLAWMFSLLDVVYETSTLV